MNGIFVTGTDTGVGKTVVSAALVNLFRRFGKVGYWKPIQTGIEQDDDTAEVQRLSGSLEEEIATLGVRLKRPLSPHLAARYAGKEIAIEELLKISIKLDKKRFWIVEGAGGLLVPINARALISDLINTLQIPVAVVSRSGLGTINHTLLTIETLRQRSLDVRAVIMVGEPNLDNRQAIEHYGKIRVIAEIPLLKPLDQQSIAKLVDSWKSQSFLSSLG